MAFEAFPVWGIIIDDAASENEFALERFLIGFCCRFAVDDRNDLTTAVRAFARLTTY